MRTALLFAILLAAPLPALAETRVDRIDIVGTGTYEIRAGQETPAADTPTGEVTGVETATNLEKTTSINGRVGVEFGLQYVVVGEPAGAEIPLDFVILYPQPGLADPDKAKPVRESRYSRAKKIGDTVYLGYGFENEWEVAPGTWTFQIWYQGKKLAEQSFTVAK